MRDRISLIKGGKGSAGQGTFAHLVGGYDAGYYGCVFKSRLRFPVLLMGINKQILLFAGFRCGHVSDGFQGGPVGPRSWRPVPEEYPDTGW